MRKLSSFVLLISMAFVLCGCQTKFDPVEKDEMIAALEQYFGYEEGVDFEVLEDYTKEPSELQLQNGFKNSYDLECCIRRIGWEEDPESPFIVFYIFKTQEDAQEYYNWWRKYDGGGDYHDLECRYDIDDTEYIYDFNGYYYSDNMCFQIYVVGQEDTEAALNLLQSLGLPVE